MIKIKDRHSLSMEMSQQLPGNDFKWVGNTSHLNGDFIKSYNEETKEEYFLEVNIQYPENVHNLPNDLPFFPERMKTEKLEKFVVNLYDEKEYVILIRNLKQALIHGLVFKKVHKVINFNEKNWYKLDTDMKTELRKKIKYDWDNIFGKTMENVISQRKSKL